MSEDMSENDEGDESGRTTKASARARLEYLIDEGFNSEIPTLIEALPAVGKSYGVIKYASATNKPVSIFTERHELYDQYEQWAEDEFGLTAQQLPVFHQDCPTARETDQTNIQYDGASLRTLRDEDQIERRENLIEKYDQGVSGRELHNRATEYFGEVLPCQKKGPCPYIQALDQDLSDIDVLIGNFQQAFVKQYRKDRYVIFDEFPKESFITQFSQAVASKTVGRSLSYSSDLPFENWEELLRYDHSEQHLPKVTEWLERRNSDRSTRPLYRGTDNQIDARGPLLTEAALRFERLDNNWLRADFGDGRVAVQSPNNSSISLLDPPPTEGAKGVIALDGTPCAEMWELLLGNELIHRKVFNDEQKREFLRDVLKIRIIQTTDSTKPYHSGQRVKLEEDMSLVQAIRDREEQQPAVISSMAAIEDYDQRGIEDVVDKTEHYNNLKGSGQFGTERLGIVIGCPQPSDDYIQLWGALAGHSVTRMKDENGQDTKGIDLDFREFGNLILEDSRENEVLQAAMRFGREEVDGENGATVYVHTAAIPDWVQPERRIPNIHALAKGGGVITVIEAIKRRDDWRDGEWKKSEITDDIDDLTARRVGQILKQPLAEEGYISSHRGGRGNAHIWSNECLEDVGDYGLVEW